MSGQSNITNAAAHRDRWVAVYVNYDKEIEINFFFNRVYGGVPKDFCQGSYFQKYELDDSKLIRIYYKTTYFQYIQNLKPFFFKEFSAFFDKYQKPEVNTVSFDEFAWISHQGLSKIAVEMILPVASKIIYDIQQNTEVWEIDTAIEKSFVLDLGLLFAFGLKKQETHYFYNWLFEQRMKTIQIPDGQSDFIAQLINELSLNYEGHKEMMLNYADLLIDEFNGALAFEEEWIVEWFNKCKSAFVEVEKRRADNKLIISREFIVNFDCLVPAEDQKLWPVYGHLLEVIHSMMEVNFLYELNMLFALKEVTK